MQRLLCRFVNHGLRIDLFCKNYTHTQPYLKREKNYHLRSKKIKAQLSHYGDEMTEKGQTTLSSQFMPGASFWFYYEVFILSA